MKTFSHLWRYLAELFLEWEMFQIKVVEKIKTHILHSVTFFPENRAICEIMPKNVVERGRSQIIWRPRVESWTIKAKRPKARPRLCTHTHTHTDAHTSMPSPTRARTHAQTHKNVTHIVSPRQQSFRERASVLRYTYIASLFIWCVWFLEKAAVNSLSTINY